MATYQRSNGENFGIESLAKFNRRAGRPARLQLRRTQLANLDFAVIFVQISLMTVGRLKSISLVSTKKIWTPFER